MSSPSSPSASATSKLTSSASASASSKLTTATSASATSTLTSASSASASSKLTTATSASASSKLTTATPTIKRTVSSTSLDSASSQDPAQHVVHKRICLGELSDEASSSSDNDSGESDPEGDDDHQEEEEQEEEEQEDPVWEMMAPNKWDALCGTHCKKTIEWKKEMGDLVEVFGPDSEIMRKLQGLATGVVVELADGKVLKINGPAQKVGHLINVMQRLLVVFGPATKNYIAIIVGGPQVVNHLAVLQQTVGANGRVAMEEKLHFSVCHTEGEWSAVQVAHLAKDVESIVAQAPQTIHDTFTCDDVAFFNPTGHRAQVLGVCPADQTSPVNELIGLLQDALQQKGGLTMETTTHTTIISRKKASPSLADILAPFISSSHDWTGPISIQKVAVSRYVTSLHSQTRKYFNLWEVDV